MFVPVLSCVVLCRWKPRVGHIPCPSSPIKFLKHQKDALHSAVHSITSCVLENLLSLLTNGNIEMQISKVFISVSYKICRNVYRKIPFAALSKLVFYVKDRNLNYWTIFGGIFSYQISKYLRKSLWVTCMGPSMTLCKPRIIVDPYG
jgi:hypothetical protein